MRREEAAAVLPVAYRQLMEWVDEGRAEDKIAMLLTIDPCAVAPMVPRAEAKLARLTADELPPRPAHHEVTEEQR